MAVFQFPQKLTELMAIQGLTVSALAKQSGVHYVMINRYLKGDRKGKVPSVETLVALAEALNCSLDELVGYRVDSEKEEVSTGLSEMAIEVGKLYDRLDEQDTFRKLLQRMVEEAAAEERD